MIRGFFIGKGSVRFLMGDIADGIGIMLVLEHEGEQYRNDGSINGKGKPDGAPLPQTFRIGVIFVNHITAHHASQKSSYPVGNHHEHALGTGAYRRAGSGFHKKGTGDIEEIECHAVYDTGKDDHP